MRDLLDARHKRSKAVAELEAWSTGTRKLPAAETLTDEDVVKIVHEAR